MTEPSGEHKSVAPLAPPVLRKAGKSAHQEATEPDHLAERGDDVNPILRRQAACSPQPAKSQITAYIGYGPLGVPRLSQVVHILQPARDLPSPQVARALRAVIIGLLGVMGDITSTPTAVVLRSERSTLGLCLTWSPWQR